MFTRNEDANAIKSIKMASNSNNRTNGANSKHKKINH